MTPSRSGFTLIEALISILILSIVSIGALSVFPLVSGQQADENVKNIAKKVVVDASQLYQHASFMPVLIQKNGNRLLWISCFDGYGASLAVFNSSINTDPKSFELDPTDDTVAKNPIISPNRACPDKPRTVELHMWMDPEGTSVLRKIHFYALARLGNNQIYPVESFSYYVHN